MTNAPHTNPNAQEFAESPIFVGRTWVATMDDQVRGFVTAVDTATGMVCIGDDEAGAVWTTVGDLGLIVNN